MLFSTLSMDKDIIHEAGDSFKTFEGNGHAMPEQLWAEEIPKGRQLKQNLPYGVINVVKQADSLDKGTCQKP